MNFRRLLGNIGNLPYPSTAMDTSGSERLRLEINNTQPVELIDLTYSLLALGDQYKRFVAREFPGRQQEIRLVVREIRTGSIITEIEPLTVIVPLVANINDFVQFGIYLKSLFGRLLNPKSNEGQFDKSDYADAANIIRPSAKDDSSQTNISVNGKNNNTLVQILNVDSADAKKILQQSREEIRRLGETSGKRYENEVIYLEKANTKAHSVSGTYGRSDSLGHGSVKLLFDDESVREEMLERDHNPFKVAFAVDMIVETAFHKPVAYRILKVRDVIPVDDLGNDPDQDIDGTTLFD